MAESGYEQASIAAIAKAAGLTPGLVHYHFTGKQEILLTLIEDLAQTLRERFTRRLVDAHTPRAKLDALIDAHVALDADADPAAVACWVHIGVEAIRQPEVATLYQRIIADQLATLRDLAGDALQAQGDDPARAPEIAAALLAAIQGAYQLAVAAPGTIPPGSFARALKEMASGLLRAKDEARP